MSPRYVQQHEVLNDRELAHVYDEWLETQSDELIATVEAHKAALIGQVDLMGETGAKALLVKTYLFVDERMPK